MPQAQEQTESRWSWVVLLATVVIQGLTLGFPTCIGIFFADLQHDFRASNSETSWFPSLMISLLHAGGPICSILVEHFGCRLTVMLGGVLASSGMVAGSFSRSLSQLYITAGLLTGLLLDTTSNYSYIFYMSSFFLISAALFIGLSFFLLYKKTKEKQMMDRVHEEPTPEKDLNQRYSEEPVIKSHSTVTYVTYVTSV